MRKPFLSALAEKARQDNAPFLARGLAFDVVVCLIPAIFLVFVLLGYLFASPREATSFMSTYLRAMIPFSSQQVLLNLFSLVKGQKLWGVVGFLGLLWTLTRVFGSVRTVLDVVFQVRKERGFLRGKLFDLEVMFLSTVFLLMTVLITSIVSLLRKMGAVTLATKVVYLGNKGEVLSVLLAFFFTVCLFFCLYKYIPNRRMATGTCVFSALGAGILWELAKHAFRLYLLKFANLSLVYGSFGLAFALVLWIYYSCFVFILGAEMGWVWERK